MQAKPIRLSLFIPSSHEIIQVLVYLEVHLPGDEGHEVQAHGALVLGLVQAAVLAAAHVGQELQRDEARDLAQHVGRGHHLSKRNDFSLFYSLGMFSSNCTNF